MGIKKYFKTVASRFAELISKNDYYMQIADAQRADHDYFMAEAEKVRGVTRIGGTASRGPEGSPGRNGPAAPEA